GRGRRFGKVGQDGTEVNPCSGPLASPRPLSRSVFPGQYPCTTDGIMSTRFYLLFLLLIIVCAACDDDEGGNTDTLDFDASADQDDLASDIDVDMDVSGDQQNDGSGDVIGDSSMDSVDATDSTDIVDT